MKKYSELYTVEDWLEYFEGAGRRELKANLKDLKNAQDRCKKNKREAIIALLA